MAHFGVDDRDGGFDCSFGGDCGGVWFSLRLLLLLALSGEILSFGTVDRGLVAFTGMLDRWLTVVLPSGCCAMEAGRGAATGCGLSVTAPSVVGTILEGL